MFLWSGVWCIVWFCHGQEQRVNVKCWWTWEVCHRDVAHVAASFGGWGPGLYIMFQIVWVLWKWKNISGKRWKPFWKTCNKHHPPPPRNVVLCIKYLSPWVRLSIQSSTATYQNIWRRTFIECDWICKVQIFKFFITPRHRTFEISSPLSFSLNIPCYCFCPDCNCQS